MMTPLNNQDLYSPVPRDSDSEKYKQKTEEEVEFYLSPLLDEERNPFVNKWYTPTSD